MLQVCDWSLPRVKDDDLSPPRARGRSRVDEDLSPPRRNVSTEREADLSPPRRRHDSPDLSPPRKRGQAIESADLSPPRRRNSPSRRDDLSPPRRRAPVAKEDNDQSPPRKRARHDSDSEDETNKSGPIISKKRHDSDSDVSPPRRQVFTWSLHIIVIEISIRRQLIPCHRQSEPDMILIQKMKSLQVVYEHVLKIAIKNFVRRWQKGGWIEGRLCLWKGADTGYVG